jgi:hypothetical protein
VACLPSCITEIDLAPSGLAAARYFRLTAHQPTSVFNFPEAYDLDALEGLHFSFDVPEPGALFLLAIGLGSVAAARIRGGPRSG